jgi:hypothetical protein
MVSFEPDPNHEDGLALHGSIVIGYLRGHGILRALSIDRSLHIVMSLDLSRKSYGG